MRMRHDLVALAVATFLAVSTLPAVVAIVVDSRRSWEAVRGTANGRRSIGLALVRSAYLRAVKALLTVGMVAVAWLILTDVGTLPVRVEVAVFLWLLSVSTAVTWVDLWLSHRVRRALYLAARDAGVTKQEWREQGRGLG